MITEKDLEDLMTSIIPAHKPMILHCGKGFVRDFAKQMYGGSYTFKQLLGLFRSGVVTNVGGIYEIKG